MDSQCLQEVFSKVAFFSWAPKALWTMTAVMKLKDACSLEKSYDKKKWRFQTVVLEKTLESPLDSKEIKQVHPKRNQPWIFFGRTDAEALILCLPDVKCRLVRTDPDAGKDCGQEEKGVADDKMFR